MNALRTEEVYAKAQERQARLTRNFFESSQELLEQARRGQPAGENLAREGSTNPHVGFLECLLFYYREAVRAAESSDNSSVLPQPGEGSDE